MPQFNKSAIIQLKNLNFNNPQVLVNNEACNYCNKLNYENNILEFTVPHFTLYTIEEGYYCGDNVCNNEEACSTCSQDCGSCSSPISSSTGSGGKKAIVKEEAKSPEKEETISVIENPSQQPVIEQIVKEPVEKELPEAKPLERFTGKTIGTITTKIINAWILAITFISILFFIFKKRFKKRGSKNKEFKFVQDLKSFGIN